MGCNCGSGSVTPSGGLEVEVPVPVKPQSGLQPGVIYSPAQSEAPAESGDANSSGVPERRTVHL